MATTAARREHARTDLVTVVLVVVGLAQLLPGLLAFFAPGAFYDALAGYPPRNDHFLRDLGSWQIALGAIALYGARRQAWRAPLLGLLAFLAPGVFYDVLAGFPPQNDHFLRDVGSWQIALGAIALFGARRHAWRAPLLGLLALQYLLHAISHLVNVNDTDPAWQGPFALALQVLGFLALAGLFLRERTAR